MKYRYHVITVNSTQWQTSSTVFDSAPKLGVYYFLSLTLSVCMSVCHGAPSNCFFFVYRWNWAIFWPSVLDVALHKSKTIYFDFRFRPPKPQNLLPKIWHKIAYKSACMPDRPDMFGPTRGDDQGGMFVAMATTFAIGTESNRLLTCAYECFQHIPFHYDTSWPPL